MQTRCSISVTLTHPRPRHGRRLHRNPSSHGDLETRSPVNSPEATRRGKAPAPRSVLVIALQLSLRRRFARRRASARAPDRWRSSHATPSRPADSRSSAPRSRAWARGATAEQAQVRTVAKGKSGIGVGLTLVVEGSAARSDSGGMNRRFPCLKGESARRAAAAHWPPLPSRGAFARLPATFAESEEGAGS